MSIQMLKNHYCNDLFKASALSLFNKSKKLAIIVVNTK